MKSSAAYTCRCNNIGGGLVMIATRPTGLHETDDTFTFSLRGSDLVAIRKRGTLTGRTEVHILSAASSYQTFLLRTPTALPETDDTHAFAMRGDDLVVIRKNATASGTTELQILSGASNYQTTILQTATVLPETDDAFVFVMRGDDLVVIRKNGTASGTTELQILSGAAHYQRFILQTGTALPQTDHTFVFAMMGDDVVAIQQSSTGTCTTEVHVLDSAAAYRSFKLRTGTLLHETDDAFAFVMRGTDLIAIQKRGTMSRTTELHIMGLHGYATVAVPFTPPSQEIEYQMADCDGRYGWTVAFRQTGTVVAVRIRLDFEPGILCSTRTNVKQKWKKGIIDEWSQRFACCFDPCCTSKAAVKFEVEWTSVDPHHVVQVTTNAAAHTNKGTWRTIDGADIAAHEFGHMIGFADEYPDSDCRLRSLVNTGTVMDDNAGIVERLIEPFCNRHGLRTTRI